MATEIEALIAETIRRLNAEDGLDRSWYAEEAQAICAALREAGLAVVSVKTPMHPKTAMADPAPLRAGEFLKAIRAADLLNPGRGG